MTKWNALLSSIADTIADYREGELPRPTADHVERWINQFDADVRLPILSEIDHVLRQSHFSRAEVKDFFSQQLTNKKIAGRNPKKFWSDAHILNIQKQGLSQTHIREIMGEALNELLGVDIKKCGSDGGAFVYLDDVIFSGGRLTTDLREWIQNAAPSHSTVHVIVMATHKLAEWRSERTIQEDAKAAGKTIELHVWAVARLENRKRYRNSSDVLWPSSIPNDDQVLSYIKQEEKFPFEPRTAGVGKADPLFTSEKGRQLLESEFLRAGVKIRGFCENPNPIMRPLGFSRFGVGFGSTIVTYRNCPNNAPLALWWGDPDANIDHPFRRWYPLLQRRTYE